MAVVRRRGSRRGGLTKAAGDATYVPLTEAASTIATSGATQTIPDAATATVHDITLSANCTFTFPTATSGRSFTLLLRQDGTGSRLATWPAAVKWPSGVAAVLSTAASAVDLLTFTCVAGVWYGFLGGTNLS